VADLLGCGPQLALTGPSMVWRSARAAATVTATERNVTGGVREWSRQFLLAAIGLYRTEISPARRSCCRYAPTCSQYAMQALDSHGLAHGAQLATGRLLRCRPGTSGGTDPVPDKLKQPSRER